MIENEMISLMEEYADICSAEKEISDKKEAIKKKIELHFGQNSVEHKTERGAFKMVGRTSYEYSDKVKEANAELKELMQDEQEQGIAVPSISYSLRFNPAK